VVDQPHAIGRLDVLEHVDLVGDVRLVHLLTFREFDIYRFHCNLLVGVANLTLLHFAECTFAEFRDHPLMICSFSFDESTLEFAFSLL